MALRTLARCILVVGCYFLASHGQAFSQCPSCPLSLLPEKAEKEKIYVLYFYRKTDPEYTKTAQLLKTITIASTRFEVVMKDMSKSTSKGPRAMMNAVGGVEESDMRTPAVFVKKDVFVGYNTIREGMRVFVTNFANQSDTSQTFVGWIRRFLESLKLSSIVALGGMLGLIVSLAGFIDGINPCALSILIFFVTAISPTLKERKAILVGGMSFTVGCFIAYFMLGLGLLWFAQSLIFNILGSWFYIFIGILAVLLGGMNLIDFYKVKTGRAKQMRLQLPSRVKKAVRDLIHKGTTFRRINIVVGFALGFLVSLFEFPCTGQVYLPVVALIGNPWTSVKPLFYLTLYNLMFILPMILVIVAAAFLISSKRLVSLFSRHLAKIKLAMACLFFIIATYMFGLL